MNVINRFTLILEEEKGGEKTLHPLSSDIQ